METIIEVQNIRKTYGHVTAVGDVSLTVQRGEIFAIVGPNGAGKTTTIESIIGLRQPDKGQIRVLGLNPQRDGDTLRQRIGVQLQQANIPDRMKVWEALDLFASFYQRTVPWEPLLADWGLEAKRNAHFAKLSGGQKQRLFIALALLNDPDVVFLDELTAGLDPQARRATWEQVRAIRDRGKTVMLVTHFMEEAAALADRVAIIDQGRVVALDTPQALVTGLAAGTRVRFTNLNGYDARQLHVVAGVSDVVVNGRYITVHGSGPLLAHIAVALARQEIYPPDLSVETADLEDVFIALTGRKIRE